MCGREVISPGDTQHIGQVEAEVDEPSTGSSQVGFGEKGADEETLHDGGGGKRHEEKKDDSGVAVRQNIPPLQKEREEF